MNPKEYYYNRFNRDLQELITKSSGVHGSAEREIHIPIGEITADKVAFESSEHRHFFFTALMLTFLIDQVMYTHFREDYDEFRKLTQYPKLELGVSSINLNPWYASKSTGINEEAFKRFAEFFIQDLKDFFAEHRFKHAKWDSVKVAILSDADVKEGIWGEIFSDMLQKSTCIMDEEKEWLQNYSEAEYGAQQKEIREKLEDAGLDPDEFDEDEQEELADLL